MKPELLARLIIEQREDKALRVLNKKYWPHQLMIRRHEDIQDAERWCYDNLVTANWRNVGRVFAFKNGPDATFFALAHEQQ